MNWIKTTLGQICLNQAGLQTGPFGSQLHASEYIDKGIPVVMPKDMRNQRISRESIAQITTDKANDLEKHRLQAGDVIFGRRGDIGRCALVTEQEEGWICGTGCLRARLHHDISPEYIIYYLGMPPVIYWLQSNAVGQTMLNLNTSILAALPVVLPPFPEQHKIAEILGAWDEAITLTERLIEAKQKRKKGLMQQLLTGKVRFTGFEGEWEEFRIKDLGKIVSGGTPSTANADYWNGDINWCTPTDITALTQRFIGRTKRKITQLGLANSSAKLLPAGSILVCTRATVGDCAIANTLIATNQGFKSIILNKEFSPNFVYYLLSTMKFVMMKYASGSTFLELSKRDFERLKVVIPEYEEQQKIASVLQACDEEIDLLERKAAALREQKKGLMQQLLTGKVRVKG